MRYETAGFFLSGLMPRSLIASCTTLASIFFSLRSAVSVAKHDERGVDLEEVAQRRAALAAAEAVGAEQVQRPRQPAVDAAGQHLHVVGGGDEDARLARRAPAVTYGTFGRLGRVQHVPALGAEAVAIQLGVAGDAPHVGGDVVLLAEDLLRLEHLAEDRAAAEQLRLQLRLLGCSAALQLVQPAQDAVLAPSGIGGMRVLLVHHRQVVEAVLADRDTSASGRPR